MNTIAAEDTTPRIWVGCLAHYNAGRRVGEWFDAIDGDEITLADVHRGRPASRPTARRSGAAQIV
ncbi:antirestriction protein ArdA [Microbacterium paraoxydans]|uniref:antirestriction protein ArdA n=1 Tax=Microbacterium paraoxydans TaxID=199592 RepID=UPI0011A30AF7|nr:antirestriction protein ArdA [Microbacterium paraoxydans]